MCVSGDVAGNRVLLGQTKDTPSEATRYHVMLMQYEGVSQVTLVHFVHQIVNALVKIPR